MNVYYDEEGNKLGKAYSFMRCWGGIKDADKKTDHKPHSHNPEFVIYGPYFCPGWPEIEVYDQPLRKPINAQR